MTKDQWRGDRDVIVVFFFRYQEYNITQEECARECDYMDDVVKDLALSECLGHFDIHVKNMLHDDDTGRLF